MKKQLLSLSLVICLIMSILPTGATAAEKDFFENSIILLVNSPMCFTNGKIKSVGDVSPTVINDRTLVPVRFLTESFGGTVEWNDATKTATLNCSNAVIDVPIGENKIVVNGNEKPLDVGATVISDRTMMPVRAISEALGKDVGYNEGIISLSDNDVEKYDKSSPYSRLTMDAIRRRLSLERDGKKIIEPTTFSFSEMLSGPGILSFSENDIPYISAADSYVSGGNIYIENLAIKEYSDTEHKVTFDAYNYDYVHGIVEVFDKDDKLISHKMIEPFGGTWSNIVEYGVAVYNMGVGIADWVSTGNSANFTYRNKTQTEHTPIEIMVPKNGYVHITSNPGLSKILCTYDVANIITQSISLCTSSVIPSSDSSILETFTDTLHDNITDTLSDAIISDPGLYAELITILSGDIDITNSDASAKSISKKIISLLSEKGLDIMDQAEEIALKLFAESGESVTVKLASLFIDGGIGKALDSMSLFNSASDYICFMLDIHYSTAKRSLIFRLCTDELKKYQEKAVFPGKTIYATSTGLYVKDSLGENRLLAKGDFAYTAFVTDGNDLYYHNKNTLSLNHINVKTGKDTKISDVFKYFDSYFNNPVDWSREICLSSGGIADYHDGKIYFEECGGFEIYPMCTIDIKTKEYKLTPLRNIGRLGFYGDNMYYMKQTGSFDLWPMYIANTDGSNSRIFKNDVWKFEVHDNMLYLCTGISKSYSDYNKGNLYRINLDTGKEELLKENIKPSTEFESLVKEYHNNI